MKTHLDKNDTVLKHNKKKLYGDISINLKKLMTISNISESELSRRTNVKQPIIHRLLSGANKNPKLFTIKPIADYFMISLSQLIGEEELQSMNGYITSTQHHGWRKVPLLFQTDKLDSAHKKKFIYTEGDVSDLGFAVYMHDSTMEPMFPKNCIVIAEPKLYPRHNSFIIIHIHRQTYPVVRHFVQSDNHNFINAFNDKFDTIRKITEHDKFLGTVIRTIYDHSIQQEI